MNLIEIMGKNLHYSAPFISTQYKENDNFFLFVGLLLTITIKKWCGNGILFNKLFRLTLRKKCSSDREKLLRFEAEG